MTNYLFTLTIASVQDFIKQSQKTRDLFNSSEIISSLMKKTIEEFKNKNGEVIIPENENIVSNKFVGILKNKSENEVKKIGEDLENKINNEFINFIFKETCEYKDSLKNFFQIYWVAVKLDDNYKKSYKKLERSLGAIKNIRKFEQEEQNKGKNKCRVCGERNRIDNEELCLVCLAKRKCELKNRDYPSTAKIALLDWLKDVNYEDLKSLKDKDKKEKFDEQWFYEYNEREEIKKFIEKNKLDVKKQKKYYALIQFDIDSLGKKLSSLDLEEQKELSEFLITFAQDSKKIVDKNGKTIYAGGDDFLGFVNLKYLFKTINDIYCDFESLNFKNLTFSTSIIIAHYKAPLHKVLDYSRSLIKEAKEFFDDKDAIGIMVMNSNAIISKTICKYEDFKLLEEMKEKDIAKNLHFKLSDIYDYLDDNFIEKSEYDLKIDMLSTDIKRLLKRENSFDSNIYRNLLEFLEKNSKNLNSEDKIILDFKNFIGFLKTLEQIRKVSR